MPTFNQNTHLPLDAVSRHSANTRESLTAESEQTTDFTGFRSGVVFPIPDQAARRTLLNHLFTDKCISEELLSRVVEVTQGWTPQQLAQMTESIRETEISHTVLSQIFEKNRLIIQEDFRKEFTRAHLMLPQLDRPELSTTYVRSDRIDDAFTHLSQSLTHPTIYKGRRIHTLLYGPTGGGKTTAIREFSKTILCPLIVIGSGTTAQDFISIFERAHTYRSAIIFMDDIDQFASDNNENRIFLQKQMDDLMPNHIVVVGTTLYPDRIAERICRYFVQKVPVPLPTDKEIGLFIQKTINERLKTQPTMQMDIALQQEMASGCMALGQLSDTLSYWNLSHAFSGFFAKLTLKNISVLSKEAIVGCIHQAFGSTREAVLAKAREMATRSDRYRGVFFRGANPNVAPLPAPVNASVPQASARSESMQMD